MGREEPVDESGLASPARRQELQKAMKEAQFALKWMGRSSPGRNDVEVFDADSARLLSQKADNGHRPRNSNPSVKAKEIASVRTKVLQISSREPLPEIGRTGGNHVKGDDDSFELFKKDFIEKLAEKAKERPGYLRANEDFPKPVTAQPKLFRELEEECVKAVKAHSKFRQNVDDIVKPVTAQPKLFKHTESLEHPSSFAGLPNSKKEILERTKRIIESSRALLRASSLEQRQSSSPVHQKFSDPSWISKCEKLNLVQDKRSWSKDVEDTSKEFILKFFQIPAKRTPSNSTYDPSNTDEDATPKVYSSAKPIVSRENYVAQKPKSLRQQNLGQMTIQSEKCRESQDFDLGKMLGDYGARDVSKPSARSPGRIPSSENMRRDSSRSPGRKLSSEEKRNDSSRDSSGSPGRRLPSEQRRKDSTTSPGKRLSSEERKKNSFQISKRSIGGAFPAEDLRARDQRVQFNSGRTSSESSGGESPQEPKREKEAMLKTLKMAAAVDQEHFLRALQDNGAVQSSESLSNEMDTDSGASVAALRRPSSPNGRKVSNNLRETKRDFPNEVRGTRSREPSPTARREVAFGSSSSRSREPSPTGRRDAASFGSSSSRSREPTSLVPSSRSREPTSLVPSSRTREPSLSSREPTSRVPSTRTREPSVSSREPTSLVPSTRTREPSLSDGETISYGSSGSTNTGRTASLRRSYSLDNPYEKGASPLRNGDVQRKSSGERSPSRANSPSGRSPQLSRQSSIRSSETDENESVSGGSIIEKLMKKASLRNGSRLVENQKTSSSVPGSPNHRHFQQPSSDSKSSLRRTLSFVELDGDTGEVRSESTSRQNSRASSPTSCRTSRKTSIESNVSEVLPRSLSERKSSRSRVTPVSEQSAPSPPVRQHPLSNSLRVNVQLKESTIAKLKSRSSTSPTGKTTEESCHRPIAAPERTTSTVTSGGSPWSPGSDDSGSEGSGCSGIEQPSPVSVLAYNNNRRTPFQEESRLSPLEHKLQVLHDRIRKSKTDVSNQKKARLEKIKATEAQLQGCVVTELDTEELLKAELKIPKTAKVPQAPKAVQLLLLPAESDVEEKKPLAPRAPKAAQLLLLPAPSEVEEKKPKASSQLLLLPAPSAVVEKRPLSRVIPVVRDEKVEKARAAAPILDFCTSLETLNLKNILPWAEEKKWDLIYIRDVLLASNFGRDKSSMTKWYSISEPMDPCLFEKLEEYYRFGKKFSGSQFLRRLAESQEGYQNMQAYVQRIFFDPAAREKGNIDTMNRCFIFDVVNETLAKKLVPHVALPRPWMKPLAKPVVRPRPTGSALMQEIWTDIYDQIGNNGSMSMDKTQLHQSLEDLISEDLFRRTALFPAREVERAAERVGIELERRILDDLLEETVNALWNSL